MLKAYYKLTKPGIIYGNAIAVVSGFLFASEGSIDVLRLFYTLLGSALCIAAGCVYNNVLDRDIDKKMARTKLRSIVTGEIPITNALVFATTLTLVGVVVLLNGTNLLTTWIGFTGIVLYVLIYGLAKRQGPWGTEVGSIAGAVPPVAGFTAVTGSLEVTAWLLLLISAIWQMSHFYGIAIYRVKEYAEGGVPLLSVIKGTDFTKKMTMAYLVLYPISTSLLYFFGGAGITYLVVLSLVGIYGVIKAYTSYHKESDPLWGRSVFKFSLVQLLVFSLMISLDAFLP